MAISYFETVSAIYGTCDDCGKPYEPGWTVVDVIISYEDETDRICELCYKEISDN